MTTIKAPYRFVPLSEKIVSPYWKHAVSHDIPFENGVSGSFSVELKAHSPIFIGAEKPENNTIPMEFCSLNGKYFIPATSLKGMVRNVVEIMSFGSMKPTIDNTKYAFRDLKKEEYTSAFTPSDVFCGYLRKESNNAYILRDCGHPVRISQEQMDAYFGTDMVKGFDKGGKYISSKPEYKCAEFKYKKFGHLTENEFRFEAYSDKNDSNKLLCQVSEDGSKLGKIIFTGQPGPNGLSSADSKRKGKHNEFVFFSEGYEIALDQKVIQNFKFAYFDHDKNKQSIDWKWRKEDLEKGQEIPIFFQKDEKGEVIHLGLSFLYKLPYTHDIHSTLSHTQKTDDIDMASLIFGYIKGKKGLKGRVRFSNAFAIGEPKLLEPISEVLSTPSASYYPFYLKQGNGSPKSYMDDSAALAGWKRYPLHKDLKKNPPPNNNVKISVKFKPLAVDTTFSFKVHYHNLKLEELGAILSAMSFHGVEEAFHNIGMAKPLGYGKVKLSIEMDEKLKTEAVCAFENFMDLELKQSWKDSEQIKELIALCIVNEQFEGDLGYMKDAKDYAGIKTKDFKPLNSFRKSSNFVIPDWNCNQTKAQFRQAYEKDKEKLQHAGDMEVKVYAFIEKEKQALQNAFEAQKHKLLDELEAKRLERIGLEQKQIDEAIAKEKAEKASKPLKQFIEELTIKDFKTFKNSVAKFGRDSNGLNDKQLAEKYKDGFITSQDDMDYIFQWLKNEYNNANSRIQKDFKLTFDSKHPYFKEVILWVGEDKARDFYTKILN